MISGTETFSGWSPSPEAFSDQNASLCEGYRDGHRKDHKPRCLWKLRPKTKRYAKPVDLAGRLKRGGGALCHEETANLCRSFVSKCIPLFPEQAKYLYADTQPASILQKIYFILKILEDNCDSLSPFGVISKSNYQRCIIPFPSNRVAFQSRTD